MNIAKKILELDDKKMMS